MTLAPASADTTKNRMWVSVKARPRFGWLCADSAAASVTYLCGIAICKRMAVAAYGCLEKRRTAGVRAGRQRHGQGAPAGGDPGRLVRRRELQHRRSTAAYPFPAVDPQAEQLAEGQHRAGRAGAAARLEAPAQAPGRDVQPLQLRSAETL